MSKKITYKNILKDNVKLKYRGGYPLKEQVVYYSKITNPEEFPTGETLYCFHPKIAQWLARRPRLSYYLMKFFGGLK